MVHNEEIDKIWTYPRIYVEAPLKHGEIIELSPAHAHYFKNVLRRQDGNFIRLFNGHDGEWVAALENLGKKSGQAVLKSQSREQPSTNYKTALYFAPIKKSRMDTLIEKAVELGVTDLIPTITARTENRKFKRERIEAQILEAAEQCERLEIPTLHKATTINALPSSDTIYACIERNDEGVQPPFIADINAPTLAFLVGPEGGFTDDEIKSLHEKTNITPITLGDSIYRAETASIICLTHAAFLNQK